LRNNFGSLAIFAAIRRALAGCTPGAASIYIWLSISLIKIKDGWHADHASFSFG
jgi:hypothetical protein